MSIFTAVVTVLGGLALFLLGMTIMTSGLREAAGKHLRKGLAKTTKHAAGGYALGSGLGFIMHSSAASVITVGFVNAGLLTLPAALPVLYGLNLGTTLSMQLLSFRLTDLAYLLLFLGFACQMIRRRGWLHHGGRACMGFGMLFLGMDIMGGVLADFEGDVAPALAFIDGTTWRGMVLGILIATLVTGFLQSSGAVIGMTFVMLEAGIFTSLGQVYPIILGAHIGTSVTALLGSIGTGIEARRTAVANLSFNLFNVLLGIILAVPMIRLIEWLTSDTVHQAAHAHTGVMLVAGLILLPFAAWHARTIRHLTPSRRPVSASSHLDQELLKKPEAAIRAVLLEMGRALTISRESLGLCRQLQENLVKSHINRVRLNEETLNAIKLAIQDYLPEITRRYLSRRQALMVQYLARVNTNIERIGDHIETLAEIPKERASHPTAALEREAIATLTSLIEQADGILKQLTDALDPEKQDFQEGGRRILEARDAFVEQAERAEADFNKQVAGHQVTPLAGLYFNEVVLALQRLVRHGKVIATELKQPYFSVKSSKLDREEERAPTAVPEKLKKAEPIGGEERE